MLSLAIHGAAGRMGRRVVALAAVDPSIQIVAALENPESQGLGQDAGTVAGIEPIGIPMGHHWPETVDVVIDFSLPSAIDAVIERSMQLSCSLVVATTGLTSQHHEKLQRAAQSISIVQAPSMSPAVNLSMKLVGTAVKSLRDVPGGLDVEIIERHHRFKADAPSGTALRFGEIAAHALEEGKETSEPIEFAHGREGETGQRPRHQIGYHAVRTGDDPGRHTIVLGMLGERVEIDVAASNRDCYASGAIAAAKWVQSKPPGLYSMFDVLGL